MMNKMPGSFDLTFSPELSLKAVKPFGAALEKMRQRSANEASVAFRKSKVFLFQFQCPASATWFASI
jgi:hypothetical protein